LKRPRPPRPDVPTVTIDGDEVDCEAGSTLRDVLVRAGKSPHNGPLMASCQGHGTCGTCAVAVDGDVGERTRRERWRLSLPPHDPDSGLRLACQTTVEGDVTVTKYPGAWGQHVEEEPVMVPTETAVDGAADGE
jgi:ferredoxin